MIICNNDDCYYNKNCRDCTFNGDIIIDDEGSCQSSLMYWYTQEYQHEFYVARKDSITGKAYRDKMFFGAVTECEGFTLYYQAKELSSETWVTEKRTGVGAYYRDFTNPESLKEIKKKIKQYPNVNDLPDKEDILKERLKGDVK
ncbi:MAG: hypothetical protein K6F27_13570 [Ruminococcus sp.]|nr:hypothetical protein [Ruminococcus sp.]